MIDHAPNLANAPRIPSPLPWGTTDLDPLVQKQDLPERQVRCYVRGCQHWLRPPSRAFVGDGCPEHHIRCHLSGKLGTYSYRDHRRNLIVGAEAFQENIIGHPFKFETHRFGFERSEDALTWNVFRSLYEHRLLSKVAFQMTGQRFAEEPQLYLWGISMDNFQAWPLLEQAREHFESYLPVERPLTEPDIALYLPGAYLLLIEAKFTSANTFYQHGPRANASSLTQAELVEIYQFPEAQITNPQAAQLAPRVPQQLWRNTVFAEYMALHAQPGTQGFHVNLVRRHAEEGIEAEFHPLLQPDWTSHFRRITWEGLTEVFAAHAELQLLTHYLHTKTAGLKPAFDFSSSGTT